MSGIRCASRVSIIKQRSFIQACIIARILSSAPGRLPPELHLPPPPKARARRTPRVLTDPRASASRDAEACRSPICLHIVQFERGRQPQVRPTYGVPRAVFEGLLRTAPGGLTFSGNLFSLSVEWPPLHRFGNLCSNGTSGNAGMLPPVGFPVTRGGAPGQCGLDRRGKRRISSASCPSHRLSARLSDRPDRRLTPRPASEDA